MCAEAITTVLRTGKHVWYLFIVPWCFNIKKSVVIYGRSFSYWLNWFCFIVKRIYIVCHIYYDRVLQFDYRTVTFQTHAHSITKSVKNSLEISRSFLTLLSKSNDNVFAVLIVRYCVLTKNKCGCCFTIPLLCKTCSLFLYT